MGLFINYNYIFTHIFLSPSTVVVNIFHDYLLSLCVIPIHIIILGYCCYNTHSVNPFVPYDASPVGTGLSSFNSIIFWVHLPIILIIPLFRGLYHWVFFTILLHFYIFSHVLSHWLYLSGNVPNCPWCQSCGQLYPSTSGSPWNDVGSYLWSFSLGSTFTPFPYTVLNWFPHRTAIATFMG